MKIRVFNTRLIILATMLLVNVYAFGQRNRNKNDDFDGPSKSFSKSYAITANDKLQIENSYGKVTVNTWDKNEFKVDVQIKAASDRGDSQKILDNITISDSKNGSTVSFKTNIGRRRSFGNQKLAINYTVYMPSKNALDVSDDYGAITLPDLDGKVVVNSTYGSLTAKSLTNNADNLNLSYSDASIESLKIGKIAIEYGNLNLTSADQLIGNFSYAHVKIGKLNTSGNFSLSYTHDFVITDLDRNFKKLSATAEYSNITLKNDDNANFDVTIENGKFSYGSKINILSKTPPDNNNRGWSPTKNYKGTIGKGDSGKMISINSSYGDVRFD